MKAFRIIQRVIGGLYEKYKNLCDTKPVMQ